MLAHALEITSLVIRLRKHLITGHRAVVGLFAVGEAVGEGVVDDAILPLEILRLAHTGAGDAAGLPVLVGDHNAYPSVLRQVLR